MISDLKKYIPTALVIILGVGASISAFLTVAHFDREEAQFHFQEEAGAQVSSLKNRIKSELIILKSLVGLYRTSNNVSRAEFRSFVETMSDAGGSFQALEWIPLVSAENRLLYEQQAHQDGFTDFFIKEKSPEGKFISAGSRNEYFPVYFVEPYQGNQGALGFDLGSSSVRLQALLKARDTGMMVTSSRINLVQLKEDNTAVLVFVPVYLNNRPIHTVDQRASNLTGFILGVARLKGLITDVHSIDTRFQSHKFGGINLYIFDEAEAAEKRLLYIHQSNTSDDKAPSLSLEQSRAGARFEKSFYVGDRKWVVVAKPVIPDLGIGFSDTARLVLLGALSITGLLTFHLYSNLKRTQIVEGQFQSRTEELNLANLALLDREQQLATIFDNVIDGIITIDSTGSIQNFNPAAERIFGYDREEVIGHNVKMLMPEPYHGEHDGYLSNYMQTGVAKIIGIGREVSGLRKNGTTFPMELGVGAVQIDKDTLFVGIIRDVTEHRESQDALESAISELEAIFNTVVDGIITINAQGSIQTFNPAAEQIFGYAANEVIGKNVKMLMPEPYHSEHDDYLNSYLETGEANIIGIGREVTGLRKDNTTFPMSLGVSAVEKDKSTLFTGIVRDITVQRDYQDNLQRLNSELESFAYTVSHDLRGPLRSMSGFSQALIEDCVDQVDETGRDYLYRIAAAAEKMGRLIDDILTLSRLSRSEIRIQNVNLTDLANGIVADLRERDPDRTVDVQISPNIVASGDVRLLAVVLENLLGNAWKFTANSYAASVEFNTITQESGNMAYYVRDNGVGFDMAYVDKLFAPFQRLHSDAEFEGTGIGLATVSKVVARHKGKVWAQSTIGETTTIYFSLPPKTQANE